MPQVTINIPDAPEGPQGKQGPMGQTGPVGPKGDQGPQGVQGVPGKQGITGPKGDIGPQGIPGPAASSGPAFIANQTIGQYLNTPSSPALSIGYLNLVFNNIVKNTGGYNNQSGVFTAPKAGYYQVEAGASVTPASLSVLQNYYGAAAIVLFQNSTQLSAGPFIDMKGLIMNGQAAGVISTSTVSSLVYLNAGDTIQAKLGYNSNAPANSWNTIVIPNSNWTQLIKNYFSAVWIRG
jgi:hypothetical protein